MVANEQPAESEGRTMQSQITGQNEDGQMDQRADGIAEEMTLQPPPLDEAEVRLTAYFLWEQDGRPEGRDEYYWWSAVEKIARQKSSDVLLQSNGTAGKPAGSA